MTRPLAYQALRGFVDESGEWRELREPTAPPTPRQWSALNRMGCIAIVEPGEARELTRSDVAGAIAAATEALERGPRGDAASDATASPSNEAANLAQPRAFRTRGFK